MCHLEEAVVRAYGEVIGLRDVVHQGPEVLDSVKGGHLQNNPKLSRKKIEQKSRKQWEKVESGKQRDKQTNRHGTSEGTKEQTQFWDLV